jgi:hypothetical protein
MLLLLLLLGAGGWAASPSVPVHPLTGNDAMPARQAVTAHRSAGGRTSASAFLVGTWTTSLLLATSPSCCRPDSFFRSLLHGFNCVGKRQGNGLALVG